VVRIARLTVSQEPRARAFALQQRKACRFPQADAAATQIERSTRLRRHELERVEAEQYAAAQGIEVADQGIVRQDPDGIPCYALSQQVIVGILAGRLDALPPEPLDDVLVREDGQRQRLTAILDGAGP